MIELAEQYGSYGYRKILGLVQQAGWEISLSVERIWRREGLKVPKKQPKRARLWLSDGSCIRLRAERPGRVWSYDFVEDITDNGRRYRMLNIIDEYSCSRPVRSATGSARYRFPPILRPGSSQLFLRDTQCGARSGALRPSTMLIH